MGSVKKVLGLRHTSHEGAIYSVKTNPASKTHENLGRVDVPQMLRARLSMAVHVCDSSSRKLEAGVLVSLGYIARHGNRQKD